MNATILVAVASLIAATSAQAEPTSPAATATASATAATAAATQAEPAAPARGPETRYCYKTEATGSHLVQRVCRTRAQWKEQGVIVPATL